MINLLSRINVLSRIWKLNNIIRGAPNPIPVLDLNFTGFDWNWIWCTPTLRDWKKIPYRLSPVKRSQGDRYDHLDYRQLTLRLVSFSKKTAIVFHTNINETFYCVITGTVRDEDANQVEYEWTILLSIGIDIYGCSSEKKVKTVWLWETYSKGRCIDTIGSHW